MHQYEKRTPGIHIIDRCCNKAPTKASALTKLEPNAIAENKIKIAHIQLRLLASMPHDNWMQNEILFSSLSPNNRERERKTYEPDARDAGTIYIVCTQESTAAWKKIRKCWTEVIKSTNFFIGWASVIFSRLPANFELAFHGLIRTEWFERHRWRIAESGWRRSTDAASASVKTIDCKKITILKPKICSSFQSRCIRSQHQTAWHLHAYGGVFMCNVDFRLFLLRAALARICVESSLFYRERFELLRIEQTKCSRFARSCQTRGKLPRSFLQHLFARFECIRQCRSRRITYNKFDYVSCNLICFCLL